VGAFVETWRLAALEPARFFRQVRVSEPRSAVLFGLVAFTLGTWGSLLFRYATASATMGYFAQFTRRMGQGKLENFPLLQLMQRATLGTFIAQLILTPLMGFVLIYLTAGIFHLLLLMVRGAPRGFDATLTVVGYAWSVLLLEALPLCGGIVALVWYLVLAVTGLAEAQRCGGGKAAFAVLMPLLLMCVIACAAGALLAAFFGSGIGTPPQSTGI
jgi:hypothetical protein